MPIYKVWFKNKDADSSRFEVIKADVDFDRFCGAIDQDRRITGERLLTRRDPEVRGLQIVMRRVQTTFLGGAVDRVEVACERFEEAA